MPKIDVCHSPTLLQHYQLAGKCVVIIDILRATSTIVAGLGYGIRSFYPVATLDECRTLGNQGYLTAAEREGIKEAGFDLGNSPLALERPDFIGKDIAITTTNGTVALHESRAAKTILAAGFINLDATCQYLANQEDDVLMVCAGWKGLPSAEDTLFAGAVADLLINDVSYYHLFQATSDAAHMAIAYHHQSAGNYKAYLKDCSHVTRLAHLGIGDDINFCLTANTHNLVAGLMDNHLVRL